MDQAALLDTVSKASGGAFGGITMWGIMFSTVFSVAGLIYVKQGRADSDVNRIGCGIGLMVYPFFVTNTLYIILVGAALAAAPFLLERF